MLRYPDELAWQLDLDRMLIRQNDKLKRLHQFLVQETESVCACAEYLCHIILNHFFSNLFFKFSKVFRGLCFFYCCISSIMTLLTTCTDTVDGGQVLASCFVDFVDAVSDVDNTQWMSSYCSHSLTGTLKPVH